MTAGAAPVRGETASAPTGAAPPRVALRAASKSYGPVRVLDALDLEVAAGERVAVIGPSGSGKTTVLRLVAGLDLPDSGRVEIDGRIASDPRRHLAPHLRGVAFAFQRATLWPHMTVVDNVAFGLHRLSRRAARERAREWLVRVGLGDLDGRYPDQLSGGQAQRAELARALAPEPRTLLLDEPLAHLEPELRRDLADLVVRHADATGASVLLVTHDLAEAAAMAGRVLRLTDGRLHAVAEGEVT